MRHMHHILSFITLFLAAGGFLACENGGDGQAECDLTTCEEIPAAKCLGAVAVSYEPTSLCDADGQCLFSETRLNCDATERICLGGVCLTPEEALCAEAACDSPPSDACNGNTAIVYNETGACNDNGFCAYDFVEVPCGENEICSEGVCVVDDGSDPCLGVVCDEPPAATCNGNAAVTYAETGVCNAGECFYEPTETPCDENTSCSNGVCLDDSDPCAGVNCTEPPADACFGNIAIAYPAVGVCNDGICAYPSTETECGTDETCEAGQCVTVPDPCAEIVCDTPPAPTCDGNSVVTYATAGTCVTGECTYETASTEACAASETCSNGVCVPSTDPCAEVSCDAPPADACNGNNTVNYPATGVCDDGECTYTSTETPCASTETCAQGVCLVVDPCEGVTCASPPADFCNGNSAVTYSSAGTCNEGDCNYASTTEACGDFAFCESGACVPTTETKIVINEIYYNPPTTQGDDLDYEFLELYNAGQTVNLENWVFTSGITHTFEAITFESGTFLLLVNRPENYDHLPVTVVEWNSGNLKNDIETLTLKDPTGAVMDGMTYDVRAASGWPTAANGGGKSLELGHPSLDNTIPANWHASEAVHGSPGAANSPAP